MPRARRARHIARVRRSAETNRPPKIVQPELVHSSPASQHSHEKRHGVVPGAHESGSQVPSTHDSHRPHDGTHSLGWHS
jgi:hypothetical protein